MNEAVHFRSAMPADLPSVEALLKDAGLPLDGVMDHLPHFLLAFRDGVLVGTGAIEPYGETGLLRSVAIRPDQRATGLGQTLTRRLLIQAQQSGLPHLVLLPTTAEGFFPRFGFVRTSREALPAAVFASAELQGACPASAVVMVLDLPVSTA